MFDPTDYPALTYQHVVDLADLFGGLPAVPQMLLKGTHEIEALIEALQETLNVARLQEKVAEDLGYPVEAGDSYPGTGTALVVDGPGAAQLLIVGTKRMTGQDLTSEALDNLFGELVDEGEEQDGAQQ